MYTKLRALNKIVSIIVCLMFIFGQNISMIAAVDSANGNQVQVTDAELKQGNNAFVYSIPGNTTTGNPPVSFVDNSQQNLNATYDQLLNYYLNYYKNSGPGWLQRTQIGLGYFSGSSLNANVTTLQPLYQSEDWKNTFFLQGNYNYSGATTSNSFTDANSATNTINIGAGYRTVVEAGHTMLGVNAFYDTQLSTGHVRVGAGAEVFRDSFELRGNYYQGISNAVQIGTQGYSNIMQQAASGYDFSLGTNLSFIDAPWLSIYAQGYTWLAQHADTNTWGGNLSGYAVKAALQVTPQLQLELGQDFTQNNFYGKFSYNLLALPQPAMLWGDSTINNGASQNISYKVQQPILRNNTIVVEQYKIQQTGTVQVLILDNLGAPLINAPVVLSGNGQPAGAVGSTGYSQTAITNSVGVAIFSAVPLGNVYTAQANINGYSPAPVTITPKQSTQQAESVSTPVTTKNITLTVIDGVSSLPIAGAAVTIPGVYKGIPLSDSLGKVQIINVPRLPTAAGTVTAAGYQAGVVPAFGENDTSATVALVKNTSTVNFTIKDATTNLPITGATITLGTQTTTTGSNGTAQLTNVLYSAAGYPMTIVATGYPQFSNTIVVDQATVVVNQNLSKSTATVNFLVKDATTNLPITGARVTLGALSATTGSNGSAQLTNVPYNSAGYASTVTATNYPQYLAPNPIVVNQATVAVPVNLTKATATVNFTIKDATTNLPITGATITLGTLTTTTDSNGIAQLVTVPYSASGYSMTIAAASYPQFSNTVVINQATVAVNQNLTKANATVNFTVTDAVTELPVDKAVITLGTLTATTGSDGIAYMENVPYNSTGYALTVTASDYQKYTASSPIVINQSTVAIAAGMSKNVATVNFTVTDATSKLPVANAAISMGAFIATTTSNGTAQLTNVPYNSIGYATTITAAGYPQFSNTVVVNSSTVIVGQSLSKAMATVNFSVKNAATAAPVANAVITFGTLTATTASDGTAQLTNVPYNSTGGYSLKITATNYSQYSDSVIVSQPIVAVSAAMVKASAIVNFKVIDSTTYAPIANAAITFGAVSTATASDGTAQLTGIPYNATGYAMTINATGYPLFSNVIVVNQAKVAVNQNLSTLTATVNITVKDVTSNQPIANAAVTFGTQTSTTSASGTAQFLEVPYNPAGYLMTIVAADYPQYSNLVVVNHSPVDVRANLIMPLATVNFVVKDATTTVPIANALITLGARTVATGSDGTALLANVPYNSTGYSMTITATGYPQFSNTVIVDQATVTITQNISKSMATVNFLVKDATTSTPVSHAAIKFGTLTATTASDGTAKLLNVPYNSAGYAMSITATNYQQYLAPTPVSVNQTTVAVLADMTRATATVNFTVKDATTSTPVADAVIQLGTLTATTDSAGKAVLTNVPYDVAGYPLTIKATNYQDYSASLPVVINQAIVAVTANLTKLTATVNFTIKDATTTLAIANAAITLGTLTVTTDSAGKAILTSVPYAATGCPLTITAYGYPLYSSTVLINQSVVPVAVSMAKANATINFSVKDAITNVPIANAAIAFGSLTATTNSDGTAQLTTVPYNPAGYAMTVTATGYPVYSDTVVVNQATVAVNANLTKSATVNFIVKDATTAAAIANAKIVFGTLSATTASDGTAQLLNVPYNATIGYAMTINATGYPQYSDTIIVNQPSVAVNANITKANATVNFTIKDSTSNLPISSAAIVFGSYSATTNTQGIAQLTNVPYNSVGYAMTITAAGYPAFSNTIAVDQETVAVVQSLSKATATVNFTVKDLTTTLAIANATIVLGTLSATTASDGTAQITNVPYNSTGYALTITATGYTQYSNPAVPITQAIVAIPVNMVKSTPASGRIDFTDLLDANNMRLTAGTLIDLFVSTQELPLSSTAYPASGDLIYTGLAAGTYVIKTKINGTYKNFQTNPVVLVLASGSMTVTASGVLLSDPGSARVTVTMKDGSTVVDGTVSAKQAGVTKAASLTSGGITTFSNNLNPGTYDFYFLPTEVYFGTPHAESLTKAITAGRTTLVNITAYIRNAFSITTVDSAGNPVNGVQIYIDGSLAGTTSAGKINANIWYAKDTGTDYSVRWVYNGHDVAVTRGLNFDTTSWGLVVN